MTLVRSRQQCIVKEILDERARQNQKFGDQSGKTPDQWFAILAEEFGEVAKEACRLAHGGDVVQDLRAELIQTAASALAFVEHGDANGWWKEHADAGFKVGDRLQARDGTRLRVVEVVPNERELCYTIRTVREDQLHQHHYGVFNVLNGRIVSSNVKGFERVRYVEESHRIDPEPEPGPTNGEALTPGGAVTVSPTDLTDVVPSDRPLFFFRHYRFVVPSRRHPDGSRWIRPRGGVTLFVTNATQLTPGEGPYLVSAAICSPSDVFCRARGRNRATERLRRGMQVGAFYAPPSEATLNLIAERLWERHHGTLPPGVRLEVVPRRARRTFIRLATNARERGEPAEVVDFLERRARA